MDQLTFVSDAPVEELKFARSRALVAREGVCLHVHHFEGERDDIKSLLQWARENNFVRVQFLVMRKACLIAFTDTLSECPDWSDLEPIGHIFRVRLQE